MSKAFQISFPANSVIVKIQYFLLYAMYIAGMVGIILLPEGLIDILLSLTPITLLATAILIIINDWNLKQLLFALICFFIGLIVEMAGVNTGVIFGKYEYGEVLGWKIFGTPLIIGVNWYLLAAASFAWVSRIFKKKIVRVISGAVVMVALDFLIEPVAIKLNFWHWYGESVPFINYLSWFTTSLLLMILALMLNMKYASLVPNHVLRLQFLFFTSLIILA